MIYHSTRNQGICATAREAVLQGLCPDGGLYVCDGILETKLAVEEMLELSYEETAFRIFSLLLDDYSEEELWACIHKAYDRNFQGEEVTPLTRIGDDWLLELYHGPTCAFKDVALCMLPQLMSKSLSGSGKRVMIVTATSGDTGKAALSGFRDVPKLGITVFYPDGKVSDIQYLQMATQEGGNVAVCGIEGNFDDAQSAVKEIFASDLGETLAEENIVLSSANSINIGRLVPQITYYFSAYQKLRRDGAVKAGEAVDFCVPTGNFGDVLAGYYAKCLGLPVHKLIVASNENRVLTDFINNGVYDRRRPFHQTISPSMDILISSNLERLLYTLSGNDCAYVAERMRELSEEGCYQVSDALIRRLQADFSAGCANDAETKQAIREAYEKTGRLIDPHTAVGYKVMRELRTPGVPCVLLSTASPYKFCKDVYEALFGALSGKADGFSAMQALYERTGEAVPEALSALSGKAVLHKSVCRPAEMKEYVRRKAYSILAKGKETE